MPDLPARPDFGQLRRQAKDLLRAATSGDADALDAIARSPTARARVAQLAVARDMGSRAGRARSRCCGARCSTAPTPSSHAPCWETSWSWRSRGWSMAHPPEGASPLGYVAMLRYDTSSGIWRDVPGADLLARA